MKGIPTLLAENVAELPRPAAVEAEDVVIPYHTPAAVPHAVDIKPVRTRERFTYGIHTRWEEGVLQKQRGKERELNGLYIS